MPIDVLKIDESFVGDMRHYAQEAALVVGILRITDLARPRVIAEGIEQEAQAETAWPGIGCHYGQGFLFGRPFFFFFFFFFFIYKKKKNKIKINNRLCDRPLQGEAGGPCWHRSPASACRRRRA